jgi:heterodisulfide reductase subunit A-like polyferredoxin
MKPLGADSNLAKSLGITEGKMGFAAGSEQLENHGVFVCGAVGEPMDIEETAVRAVATASRIHHSKEAGT